MHLVSEESLLGWTGEGSEAGKRGVCSSIQSLPTLNEEHGCVGNGEERKLAQSPVPVSGPTGASA